MCEEILKIVTQPDEDENQSELKDIQKSPLVGAKRRALRPRAGVSCNLIYRTYKTSQGVSNG